MVNLPRSPGPPDTRFSEIRWAMRSFSCSKVGLVVSVMEPRLYEDEGGYLVKGLQIDDLLGEIGAPHPPALIDLVLQPLEASLFPDADLLECASLLDQRIYLRHPCWLKSLQLEIGVDPVDHEAPERQVVAVQG